MVRPIRKKYYFKSRFPDRGFEYIDTTRRVALVDYIGETLATSFCEDISGVELVRFKRTHETIQVRKRVDDIILEYTQWINYV